jgi:hypothetical protein
MIHADCENPSGGNRDRFGIWSGWVEGEDAPAVEKKVGGG